MALFSLDNLSLTGLACAVPKGIEYNKDYPWPSEKEGERFIKKTGISQRRVAAENQTASDLCFAAAEALLKESSIPREEIDLVLFVSQTPDYKTPATAIELQNRLGLGKQCLAFDINLGCSGYVYGLATAGNFVSQGICRNALLLVGDVTSKDVSKTDKSVAPLFSDAGSATLLSHDKSAATAHFNLQSDGAGYEAIIIPDGGARNPYSPSSETVEEISEGISRAKKHMILEGLEIFNFTLREVSPNIKALQEFAELDFEKVDHFVFHQANHILNESIRKKLKLPEEKVPYSIFDYGNTSCATLPITMAHCLREELSSKDLSLVLSGFGVGLSWGSVSLQTKALNCLPIIEV